MVVINQEIMVTVKHNQWRCEMKSYDELKAEMEAIQKQMVEAKKNERANALKEVKRLCKDFEFIQRPYLPFNTICKFGN